MTWLFISLFSCVSEEPNYPSYSTVETDTSVSDSGDSGDTADSGDTGDTGQQTEEDQIIFQTFDVDCSRLELHTLTLTRIIPGELDPNSSSEDPKDALTSEFLEEKMRQPLMELELEELFEEGQAPFELPRHCRFGINLEPPEEWELSSLNGDEEDSELKWVFYYPALFVGEQALCDDEDMSCQLVETQGLTEIPEFGTPDPKLASTDFYDWASDIYFVYITGDIAGSFADMGFAQGWNLAQMEGNEIMQVQKISLGEEGLLMPVEIEIGDLLPRYSISLEGIKPGVDTSLNSGYTMGARPLPWLSGASPSFLDSQVSPINFQFRASDASPGADANIQLYLWGPPPEDHFFPALYPNDHDMYLQWADYVDVAPEIPVVFSGAPTVIDGSELIPGDNIVHESEVLGGLCRESDRLAFLYYDTPDRPSETLWYRLKNRESNTTEVRPGWHAAYGTQGEVNTWRFVIENPSSSGFTYNSMSIGEDCTAFSEWSAP